MLNAYGRIWPRMRLAVNVLWWQCVSCFHVDRLRLLIDCNSFCHSLNQRFKSSAAPSGVVLTVLTVAVVDTLE